MILVFTATNRSGEEKKYSWWFFSMEFALDSLSVLSSRGRRIKSAELIDNDQRFVLSVEAFDGSGFSDPIQQLESEWTMILDGCVRNKFMGSVESTAELQPEEDY